LALAEPGDPSLDRQAGCHEFFSLPAQLRNNNGAATLSLFSFSGTSVNIFPGVALCF